MPYTREQLDRINGSAPECATPTSVAQKVYQRYLIVCQERGIEDSEEFDLEILNEIVVEKLGTAKSVEKNYLSLILLNITQCQKQGGCSIIEILVNKGILSK